MVAACGGLAVLSITGSTVASASTTVNFSYTGGAQSWTVPTGVASIQVSAVGAQGGGTYGGLGAQVTATMPVTPGQVLQIYVGGRPGGTGGGFNGGGNGSGWAGSWGGGGASDVRTSTALTSRIVVAAGGGGTGYGASATSAEGGSGGPSTGQSGDPGCGVGGGSGGTQSAGGAGGTGGNAGGAGSLGTGGNTYHAGGGGGGGYYGGGAGADCGNYGAGGGGGSDYLYSSGTMVSEISGYNTGNGSVAITYGSGGSSGSPGSATVKFSYTGSPQAWTVPAGLTSIQVDVRGAQGGGPYGGLGARSVATLPVTPGQVLEVMVGANPSSWPGGYDGGGNGSSWGGSGGGGGASDIRMGGIALANRVVVAAGGGGGGAGATATAASGGSGGTSTGQNGDPGCGVGAGAGGSQTAGGAGGTGGNAGGTGSFGNGGGTYHAGGGGGGGYYGGGGGADCGNTGAGGGGGSDFLVTGGTAISETSGYNAGNGSVTIAYPTLSTVGPGAPGVTLFSYTGAPQTFTVPPGVTQIAVDARGAQAASSPSGNGSRFLATLPVVPGQVLEVDVGGTPPSAHLQWGAYNGGGNGGGYGSTDGGGGGASDVRSGGPTLANRILVAGGGGGPGDNWGGTPGAGGGGGPSTGSSGGSDTCGESGGSGGSQTAGGAGGGGGHPGAAGTFGSGGSGSYTGGGGGGGYYGGGGGGGCVWTGAGGGGGSDYLESSGTADGEWSGSSTGTGTVIIATGGFNATGGNISPLEEMANSAAEKFCAVCHGDPINTATGGLAESFTDMAIPGPGPALSFGRSYNSVVASVQGPFGYGWTDSYNMSLSFGTGSPPSTVTVNQENGTQVTFTNSGGTYTAPPRVMATLSDSGGTWTYTRKAKSTFTFNSSGQLTAESDLNGYTTTLSYTGSQLTTITDPEGRTLSLSYGTNGLVSQLSDSSSPARTVTYSYDANKNLTDVIDVNSGHTQFTYNSAHDLLTYRKPRYYGDTTTTPTPVTTNVYNSAGQVTSQTDPMGRTTTFSYTEFSTTITDPNGDVTVEQYRNGVLISRTTGYGTTSAATTLYTYDPNTLGVTKTVSGWLDHLRYLRRGRQ
jgi:YD repeat-containing protein